VLSKNKTIIKNYNDFDTHETVANVSKNRMVIVRRDEMIVCLMQSYGYHFFIRRFKFHSFFGDGHSYISLTRDRPSL